MSVFFPRDQRCPGPLYNILGLAHHRHRVHVEVKLVGRDCPVSGLTPEFCRQLYKNRSSRKIDSQILFLREYDFPKTFSLTENLFSWKTYFYTIASRVYRHVGDIGMVWTLDEFRSVEDKKLIGGHVFMMMGDYDSAQNMYLQSGTPVEALHMRRDLLHWDQVRISEYSKLGMGQVRTY